MGLVVVLDTNVFWSDFYMKSTLFDDLNALAKSGVFKIAIPKIVQEELIINYGNLLQDNSDELNKSIELLHKNGVFLNRSWLIPLKDIDTLVQKYRDFLDDFMSDVNTKRSHNYEKLSIADLVEYSLVRRKPGTHTVHFKDLLVWQSVLHFMDEGSDVCFVTNDSTFYSNKTEKKQLHPELYEQVKHSNCNIKLFRDLNSLLIGYADDATQSEMDWLSSQNIEQEIRSLIKIDAQNFEYGQSLKYMSVTREVLRINIEIESISMNSVKKIQVEGKSTFFVWYDLKYTVHYRIGGYREDFLEPIRINNYSREVQSVVVLVKENDKLTVDSVQVPYKLPTVTLS